MSETITAPCIYPGCRDHNGDPRLTRNTICEPSRRHYRTLLDRLVLDYLELRTSYPKPAPLGEPVRTRRGADTPGHPGQWASDKAREIADALDGASEGLREHLGHLPPPPRTNAESRVVNGAYRTLVDRFDDLCTYPGAQATATELYDLHGQIRRLLGHNRIRWHLPTPCPDCDLITLVRTVDIRQDSIECDNCARTIDEQHYGLYARVLLDEILDNHDTPTTTPA